MRFFTIKPGAVGMIRWYTQIISKKNVFNVSCIFFLFSLITRSGLMILFAHFSMEKIKTDISSRLPRMEIVRGGLFHRAYTAFSASIYKASQL